VEVDHLNGINWEHIIDYIQRHLLVHPDNLATRCVDDHKRVTEERKRLGL